VKSQMHIGVSVDTRLARATNHSRKWGTHVRPSVGSLCSLAGRDAKCRVSGAAMGDPPPDLASGLFPSELQSDRSNLGLAFQGGRLGLPGCEPGEAAPGEGAAEGEAEEGDAAAGLPGGGTSRAAATEGSPLRTRGRLAERARGGGLPGRHGRRTVRKGADEQCRRSSTRQKTTTSAGLKGTGRRPGSLPMGGLEFLEWGFKRGQLAVGRSHLGRVAGAGSSCEETSASRRWAGRRPYLTPTTAPASEPGEGSIPEWDSHTAKKDGRPSSPERSILQR
jgi:hypothetical protein